MARTLLDEEERRPRTVGARVTAAEAVSVKDPIDRDMLELAFRVLRAEVEVS